MIKNSKDEFQEYCLEFINLKRLFETQILTIELCSGKEIKDDIAYQLILFSSIEGMILRITRFIESFTDFLNTIKSSNPKLFGVGEWNKYLNKIKDEDSYLYNIEKKSFNTIKKRLFPNSSEWKKGQPTVQDYEDLKTKLYKLCKPIKDYRDTTVAHRDQKRVVKLEIKAVKIFLENSELILKDLYQLAFCGAYSFDLGGIARKPESTAKKIAKACLTF